MIANDPAHLGGAIDAGGADKASRFMQLCDAFALPLLMLCDTPGFMVGPAAEATATVRHVSRMFVTGANLSVPVGTVVLRKGYGLGAQAMAAGSFRAPRFCIGWPTAEFGGMGLEGAVRLGMRRELEALGDPAEREHEYERLLAEAYARGRGVSMAAHFEIDDVIDPADTRRWIATLRDPGAPGWWQTPGKRRPHVYTW
jgi:acetyl-CoA carboxylase carboxyltransferase component